MKSGIVKLGLVVLFLNLFFTYIGLYFLPQSESHPPREIKIEDGIAEDDLIILGEEIVFGKGQCMVCHPMTAETGMRSPAMATIGTDMKKNAEAKGQPFAAYVFDSLVNPSKEVGKGYDDIMPPVHKPPTSLTEGELIAVAAYLQSKGGPVSVSYPGSLSILQEQIGKAEGGD